MCLTCSRVDRLFGFTSPNVARCLVRGWGRLWLSAGILDMSDAIGVAVLFVNIRVAVDDMHFIKIL